jgi:GT2 family glycosyltransferase
MMYQAVSAACMLIRKEAFDKVGGLDERYWNDYSHIDFCLKLAHSGYKTVYQPKCRVVHYKRSYKIYAYTKLFENLRLFDSKWLGKVTYDYRRKTDGSYEKLPGSPIKLYYPTPAGIIVICDGNPEHTRNCVESILAHTDVPFTLLFVDREFDSEATEYMKHIAEAPNIRYCSSPESDSVSLALNKSLKENIGGITVFVKSEVAVTPGWLSRLLEAMYIEEKIGIVSTMTNKASNAQQDKNAQYSTLEEMYAYAADVSEQNKGKYFTTSRIEFFCTLVKKEVFRKIGGFDERFELGTFVDDDFSLRSKKAGFKNAVIKDVFVHRHGTLDRPGISEQEYQSRINRSKAAFIKKWGGEPEQAAKSKKRYDSKKIYFPLVTDTLSELYRRAVYYTKEEEFNLAYNYYVKLFHAPDIDTVENENMALYLNNAGKLCLRLKKFSDAIRYFIRELELNDKSVRAYESLGDAYHSLGDFNKAIEMYENALAISSTSESVRQKRQRYFK